MRKRAQWMVVLTAAMSLGCGMTPIESDQMDAGDPGGGQAGTTATPSNPSATPASGTPCDGPPVAWKTGTVSLTADAFWIVADGQCYTSRGATVDVHSDPGDSRYTSLELIWTESGREMRLFIYLKADASGWWSEEMRTYDGQLPDSDWLYYYGKFFASPIGQAFQGDLVLTNDAQDGIRGELHLLGLTLSTTMSGR
jgi:hypothetical protein